MATAGCFAVAAAQQAGGWPQYFPWALPVLVLVRQPHGIAAALLTSTVLGVAAATAGCVDFGRREVQ